MNPRILITGGSGLLGANLAEYFRHQTNVMVICRSRVMEMAGVETAVLDICSRSAVQACLDSWRPDVVIHCAAETGVDFCEQNPAQAHQVNALTTGRLAAAAQRSNAKVVYISTDSVYPGVDGGYRETDPIEPVNVYARSKLAGESAVADATDNYLILRTNMYGWNLRNKFSLAEWVLHKLAAGELVPGFDDIVFSPLLVNQLTEIIDELVQKDIKGLFNLGSCDCCSKYDFARKLCRVFNYSPELITPVSSDQAEFKAKRPKNTSMNVERAQKVLGRRLPDIDSGINRLSQLSEKGYAAELKRAYVV